ncbi:maternal embryonic leucine zipper kinase isoform X1 [Hydra vulgaris]|uniref:non-specific serine/threonine protein kinase n=1 Tax=Hydra vulgaris TaxID=6087 RepID=T2MDN6_HYDVU|nr:maternal embryonic leucine zipper kinase [Hydra vulgaris]
MPEISSKKDLFPKELDAYENKNEKLGEGGFAEVHLAEHRPTGIKVAIKVMNKRMLEKMGDLHRAYREIEAMKRLGCHQHICQLYQVVETDEDIFLVLEYVSGGELFDYIVSRERLSEKESRSFFRQIVSAVAYIHSNGLAHRDLKPENMLLDGNNCIKIIDFGLASNPETDLFQPLATCCGSPAYAAPELISGKSYFGTEADLWSLGVVLYGLLNGFLPFDVDEEESTFALYEKIKIGKFDVPEWLSNETVGILSQLLEVDPEKRITTKDLLTHPWMCEGYGSHVNWQSTLKRDKPESRIIEELSDYYNISLDQNMEDMVKEYKYDSLTAHYFLLYKLRQKVPRPKVSFKTPIRVKEPKIIHKTPSRQNCMSVCIDDIDITPTRQNRSKSCSNEEADEKVYISPLRDTREKASSHVDNLSKLLTLTPALQKNSILSSMGTTTPRFAKRIGKRVVNLMTPRKQGADAPRKVKGFYKVSTTSTKPPNDVRRELQNAIIKLKENNKIYSFELTRYLFKCKCLDERRNKLIFQLEVCSVPGLDTVTGIRHSRLKGDSWSYKKMCDNIMDMIKL